MERSFRKFEIIALIVLCGIIYSCTHRIKGYGMVLWDMPAYNLQDGAVVPVYIKSNISHVYVIGLPHSKEKVEVPVWQVTAPASLLKTYLQGRRYKEYRHAYAHVKIDGLPVRREPVNTSKQVYRLRKNETVRLLYKGKGQPVMAGQKVLEGSWLRVLTQDGTFGWCFSNNLAQFTTAAGGAVKTAQTEEIQEEDTTLKDFLGKKWYPDYYADAIRDQKIDIETMSAASGFDTGAASGTISLILGGITVSWPYAGVTKTPDGTYKYNDVPVEITVKAPDSIVLRYTDQDGKPQDFNMITVSENIGELVAAEKERRAKELQHLIQAGPSFTSSNYGQLSFAAGNTFTWTDYSLLVPSLVAASAKGQGTVSIRYFIAFNLKASYDGILTFHFDGMNKDVSFLYKIEESGLRLEDASGAVMDGKTVTARGISPVILFFARS